LGNTSVSHNLTVVSGGAIADSAGTGVSVANTSSFTTGGGGAITLGNASNALNGIVTLAPGAGDATVVNSKATQLAGTASGGNPSVTETGLGGAITQAGVLTVTGTSLFDATVNGGNAITLTLANKFTGAVTLNNAGANAVQLTNTGTAGLA